MSNYYDTYSQNFIDTTLKIDMSALYIPFVELLLPSSKILDVGCGPGRDVKYFKDCGFMAQGIEPSEKLCEFARSYTNVEIFKGDLNSFNSPLKFDGIWACASLLHIPSNELKQSIEKIAFLLNEGGVFYCSFKHGNFEGIRDGRYYNDQTSESIREYIPQNLKVHKDWITEDLRPMKRECWLNVILKKPRMNEA